MAGAFSPRPAQPYEAGNQVARKHGVWAADVTDEAREIVVGLFGPEVVEKFPLVALRAAATWVRVCRAELDVATRGEVLENGKENPLLSRITAWDNYLLAVSDRFGLNPRAEAQLARDRAQATREAVDLDAVRERGRKAIEGREAHT